MTEEQLQQWRDMWRTIATSIAEVIVTIERKWSALERARLVPRQHRRSIMRQKIRRAFR